MNKKQSLIIILIISVICFSTGYYLKFVKSFSSPELQISKTNAITGKNVERQLRLGEMIKLINNVEDTFEKTTGKSEEENMVVKTSIESPNKKVLIKLKALNYISILLMIVSVITVGLITKKLLLKEV